MWNFLVKLNASIKKHPGIKANEIDHEIVQEIKRKKSHESILNGKFVNIYIQVELINTIHEAKKKPEILSNLIFNMEAKHAAEKAKQTAQKPKNKKKNIRKLDITIPRIIQGK